MKLTNNMKERIIKSIMTDTFSARKEALKFEHSALANDVYDAFYGQHKKAMAALPESFFISKSYFDIRADGGESKTLTMDTTRLFGQCHHYSSLRLDAKDPLVIRYQEIEKKCLALNSDISCLKSTLNSIILPITTDKRLAEVWPDAEKWIPRTPTAMSNLPAVRPEYINAMIENMKGAN